MIFDLRKEQESFPIPAQSGVYLLLLNVSREARIEVGRLGRLRLQRGYYFYLGSAHGSGGLRARIRRHVEGSEKCFWHIDYLRPAADPVQVWFSCAGPAGEHTAAAQLGEVPELGIPLPGFGSSDCSCRSHLFYAGERSAVRKAWGVLNQHFPQGQKWQRVEIKGVENQ